eukprot:11195063-Lingulodinium_polyedra.AAC.1
MTSAFSSLGAPGATQTVATACDFPLSPLGAPVGASNTVLATGGPDASRTRRAPSYPGRAPR